jgi:hypothetical protein
MEQVFLEAKMPLTKTFALKNNVLEKTQYPLAKQFKSHRVTITTISDLYKAMIKHSSLGHCMLKGRLHRDLNWESRANSTLPEDDTELVVFDLDNVQGFATPQDYMDSVGLADHSYVVQYSASYKVDPAKTGLSCHIMLMATTVGAVKLKCYLQHLNLTNPILSKQVSLTATDVALSWPLDVTVAQNDKLIYISAPECVGFPDPMPVRIHLVKKSTDVFDIPSDTPNLENTEKARRQKINELRAHKGLASRRFWKMKEDGSVNYVPNPTAVLVTGVKTERGYTYLNLNHGDSWAYYHPEDDPRVISSFKGDGPFRTKDLCPDYWKEVSKDIDYKPVAGVIHMAYRQFSTAQYFNLIYDQNTHDIQIAKANSLTQLEHFMSQYNKPWTGEPTDWEHIYDPTPVAPEAFNRIDGEARTINLYIPPKLLKSYDETKMYQLPDSIWNVIKHACGGHEEFAMNMINGWAYIMQTGNPVHTCMVLHGTTGTGKGIIINEILPRVFGETNISIQKPMVMNEPYNGYMENAQIVVYEEVDAAIIRNAASASSFLKNSITEPTITIRKMYTEPRSIKKRCSIMMTANSAAPVSIPYEDRRFNCAEYQSSKFTTDDQGIDQIRQDCEEFYGFLRQYKYDSDATRKIIQTDARKKIMATSATGLDEFAEEIVKKGNFMYLLDMLPMNIETDVQVGKLPTKEYAQVVALLFSKIHMKEQTIAIFRDELKILLMYLFSNIPENPAKFSSMVKHHRMYMDVVRRDGAVGRGIYVKFKFTDDDLIQASNIYSTTLKGLGNE